MVALMFTINLLSKMLPSTLWHWSGQPPELSPQAFLTHFRPAIASPDSSQGHDLYHPSTAWFPGGVGHGSPLEGLIRPSCFSSFMEGKSCSLDLVVFPSTPWAPPILDHFSLVFYDLWIKKVSGCPPQEYRSLHILFLFLIAQKKAQP